MDALLLLHECRRRGIELRVDGGRLLAKGVVSLLSGPIAAELSRVKGELIPFLEREAGKNSPQSPLSQKSGLDENAMIERSKRDFSPLSPLSPKVNDSLAEVPISRHTIAALRDGNRERIIPGDALTPLRRGLSGLECHETPLATAPNLSPTPCLGWTKWPESPADKSKKGLPWRSIVGAWPVALREKWGRLANDLAEAGMEWPSDEAEAFRRVVEESRPDELP